MNTLQILIHEPDSRLTAMLGHLPYPLRHPRTVDECLEMLQPGDVGVVVVKLGVDVEKELELVARVATVHPDAGIVVVGEAHHAPLAGLAWDLGASHVLFLPQPRDLIVETVAGLLHPVTAREK